MKTLRPSTQYKKDLKNSKQPQKAEALLNVLRLLENELSILAIYKPVIYWNYWDYSNYWDYWNYRNCFRRFDSNYSYCSN